MTKGKKKFYAVARGRNPGIYTEWFGPRGAEVQIHGFPGAIYKGFSARAEAQTWLKRQDSMPQPRLPHVDAPAESQDNGTERIRIFTDGGSIDNPGPGGYGIVILYAGERRELSGGFRRTTNNRMELMGCIVALSQFKKPGRFLLSTDSQYVVNGITKGWAKRWRKNCWMRTPEAPAENSDLWEKLLELTEMHDTVFEWVRGHAGHPENERCDQLARVASAKKNLPPDTPYEQNTASRRP